MRAGRRQGVGWRQRNWPARGWLDSTRLGARARAERTEKMPFMSVTLDVSKLSGWLKAAAPCRVETRYTRCGVRGAAREAERREPPAA